MWLCLKPVFWLLPGFWLLCSVIVYHAIKRQHLKRWNWTREDRVDTIYESFISGPIGLIIILCSLVMGEPREVLEYRKENKDDSTRIDQNPQNRLSK